MDDYTASLKKISAIAKAAGLPGVEEGESWGTPALKVRGKMLVRVREPGILVVPCDLDEKEMLMTVAPEIFFQTKHYEGWPGVLVRLEKIEDDELAEMMEKVWRTLASKKMIADFEASKSKV